MSKRIPQEIIDNILTQVHIEDVVKDYVELRKAGVNLKGKCPYGTHTDSNPSFIVSPSKNICNCFSCNKGGNAIKFYMDMNGCTYREAIIAVGKKVNIEVPEEDMTPQQEAEYKEKEAIIAAYEFSKDFYINYLNSNNPNAIIARKYAYTRWGEEFCKEYGIGFAPLAWSELMSAAISKGYNIEVFYKAGLLTKRKDGKGYRDFFMGRVMIPVHDSNGHVVSYTARIIKGVNDDYNEDNDVQKYMNTTNTLVFNKSNIIFGFDIARREATRNQIFTLVEGAPDVLSLHKIGITNAVASLGTAWTPTQFKMLKRYANKIEFIPDSDIPKEGQKFGPGFESVFRNGKTAIACGFNVTVRQIPLAKEKQDAGSYITSKEIYDRLNPVDFIIWYAEKILSINNSISEQMESVKEIADIVKSSRDEIKKVTYIEELSKIDNNRARWEVAILGNETQNDINGEIDLTYTEEQNFEAIQELLEENGITIENNCYFKQGKKGRKRCSNFIIIPMLFIDEGDFSSRLFKVINEKGDSAIVEMKSEDMIGTNNFCKKVEARGHFMWEGNASDLTEIRGCLYSMMNKAIKICNVGWQLEGFYAYANGIMYKNRWYPINETNVVHIDNVGTYYLPFINYNGMGQNCDVYSQHFQYRPKGKYTLEELCDIMDKLFGDKGIIGFVYAIATLFRSVIHPMTKGFPILDLAGEKGSGKSGMTKLIMSWFLCDVNVLEQASQSLDSTTQAALGDYIGSVVDGMILLDEYFNKTIDPKSVSQIKGIWDGYGRTKMDVETKKKVTPNVGCGVILSGQDIPTVDAALYSRTISLVFEKPVFTTEQREEFDDIIANLESNTHIAANVMSNREYFEENFWDNYKKAGKDIRTIVNTDEIEGRVIKNWTIPLATVKTLMPVISFPFTYERFLKITTNGIISQDARGSHTNELAVFWRTVKILIQEGELIEDCDYAIVLKKKNIICFVRDIEQGGKNVKRKIILDHPVKVIYLRLDRILALYQKHIRNTTGSMVSGDSIEMYLENSKEYIGKAQKRFQEMKRGEPIFKGQPIKDQSGIQSCKKVTDNIWCSCMNYDALQSKYELDFESHYIYCDAPLNEDNDE